jgi:crotonobetainyl-CoA:carnitine CoA-transferase CaiB-like acyl-CoA transferase
MSGAAHLTGFGDKPVRMASPYVDFMSATLSVVGVLAALRERDSSGKGQMIETALLKSALNVSNALLIEQAMLNLDRERVGNRAFTAGPGDSYRCRDGWIYVLCIGQPLFVRWCKMMGRDELIDDPRFKDDLARGDNGEEISAIMQEWCATRGRDDVLKQLAAARVPAGPIYTPQEALDDPHVREAGFFKQVDYPGLSKPYPILDQPVKLSRTPLEITRRPPTLGEHTDEILGGLGYSKEQIADLRKQRVV